MLSFRSSEKKIWAVRALFFFILLCTVIYLNVTNAKLLAHLGLGLAYAKKNICF